MVGYLKAKRKKKLFEQELLYVNIVNIEEFLVAEILDGVGWANFLFDLVDEEGDEVIWEVNGFEGD